MASLVDEWLRVRTAWLRAHCIPTLLQCLTLLPLWHAFALRCATHFQKSSAAYEAFLFFLGLFASFVCASGDLLQIPVVTRSFLALSVLTTAGCELQILSPMWVYFNAISIFREFELWRLVTNFFFFGKINIDFFFHMFFLTRYAKMLEEGSFRGRSADFLWMLIFGGFVMCCIAPFVNIHFLGSSLTFMMVYVWGRRNENVHMSVLGLLHFTAPYFPWVLLGFSLLIGKDSRTVDLVGMVAGHMYFFLEDVFPQLRGKRPLKTPRLLHALFGTSDEEGDEGVVNIRANLNQQHAVHQRQQQQQQQEEQLHEHRGENERAASEAAADEQDVGQSGQERSTSASLKNNSPGEEDSGLHHPASFERHAKNNHAEANSVAHEARFRGETDAGTSGEDSASKHARSSPTDRNGLGQKEHDE